LGGDSIDISPGTSKNAKSLKETRILAIDDEVDILVEIKDVLEHFNSSIRVDTFRDPDSALKQFGDMQEGYYSVVLADIRMPRMSGVAFAREIRSMNHKVKIMLMSAFEINKDEIDSRWPMLDVDEILCKPFSIKQIANVLAKYIDKPKNIGDFSSTGRGNNEGMFFD